MKNNKKTLKEKLFISGVWVFSFVYAFSYIWDINIPITEGLKGIYEPVYEALFGGKT
ncbi:hypothetical protein [Halobacillus sp. Marseille-Q1614]|uniref:hypothetical protein n=1 Tax=Halobacillus sp. Marseille-Q1614 TaxID=2709134 RepID=UPI001570A47B|nr:hypothetical protein [Halobacillus sp. Marseille-Q1614]